MMDHMVETITHKRTNRKFKPYLLSQFEFRRDNRLIDPATGKSIVAALSTKIHTEPAVAISGIASIG